MTISLKVDGALHSLSVGGQMKQSAKKKKIAAPERKFFVLREVEVEAEDLRKGDVFRIEPASALDHACVNPRELFIMRGDAKMVPVKHGTGQLNLTIEAAPVAIIERECFVANGNFGKWSTAKLQSALKSSGFKLEKQKAKAKKPKKKAGK